MTQISLRRPFTGDYPISFPFGREATDPAVVDKFKQWGIIGHHGVDIAIPEGTPVLACAEGTVVQSGENGDWGISVTISHAWGTSIYAHLKDTLISNGQSITESMVIGHSGSTGAAFGPHLHFGIKPTGADEKNGYLGFVDPTPYLSIVSPVESSTIPPATIPITPSQSTRREIPVEELIEVVLKKRLANLRQKANAVRRGRRDKHLIAILALAKHGPVTNILIRETLRVSRATTANYLKILVAQNRLSRMGRGPATTYISV